MASQNQNDQKDDSLSDFLQQIDKHQMAIPDALIQYHLQKSGVECDDERVRKIVALAAQKFIHDISHDAFQYCKIRQQSVPGGSRPTTSKDKKLVLTMEDLISALHEYGINVKKPEYYT